MGFYDVLDQVLELLCQRGRVTYRALKREFHLDDEALEALKEELFFAHPVVDQDGRGLVWTGEPGRPESTSTPTQSTQLEVTKQAQPSQVERPITEPQTPNAERRQLSILFTDLVDSTKLSGKLDAEDYREIVRAYQATCADVIERFNCHLAQTLGDGLLIYSGYPIAHENDAERAIRVGLGILDAIRTLNEWLEQDKGIQLALRVGIHTGSVVIGEVGAGSRLEQLALGEVPNVAARIQGLAEPDTVIISEATYQLVEGYFECEPLGAHDLRGVSQPIAVYRVLRESGVQNRLDIASTRGLTPLVGRESEVALLLERWEQAKAAQGQVILLSGEAGIGKSRLVQVLKDHLADEPHTRWECRSSPYYHNTALYPIINLIERTLRWQPDDTTEEKLAKLEQQLSQYHLPLEETVPLFAPLLSLSAPDDRYPQPNFSPQQQRQKTLEAILAVLLELAEQHPILFILEDLHWTDPTSLELLDLLIEQTPTASLCVLLTCRPEYQPSWSHRSYLTEITVNRLSWDQIERMAHHVVGGKILPTDIIQQLVAKTDGVPLFVEEMTKALLESGYLKEMDGRYELTGALSSLAIPVTLQDSLMSRLDRLVSAKGIAQLGAVMGRQFSYELLQAVSQLDETMLQHELGRLVDAELVYQRGLPPQATYTFKHALIQDTAYESLLRRTRQGYHRHIAEVLEERFPETAETQPELLAHHYTEAGLDELAIPYWQRAGQQAAQRSAHQEAIGHLTKGIEALQTLPDTPERTQQDLLLHVALGVSLMAVKGRTAPEVERVYTRARTLCQQVGDTPQLFPVLRGLFLFYLNCGQRQTAQELAEQLLRQAERQPEMAPRMLGHYLLGQALFLRGALEEAAQHFAQAIAAYDLREHRQLAHVYGIDLGVITRSLGALVLWLRGYPDRALVQSQEAWTLAREVAHPLSLVLAQVWLACLHQFRQEAQAAHDWAAGSIALAVQQGFSAQYVAWGTMPQGWALTQQAQWAAGMAKLREGSEAAFATGSELWRPYFLALLAEAAGAVGQPEDGLRLLAEAQDVMTRTDERFYEAELSRLMGVLHLARSPAAQAEAEGHMRHALNVARRQQAKSWELRTALSLSRLWQQQGKRAEAYELLAPIYEWFTEGVDTADLQEAKLLLVELS
jgi:class 3 adenylate cyclase/predicted ATPase